MTYLAYQTTLFVMKEKTYFGKTFRETISKRIDELAAQINSDYAGKDVIFLGILNGSFLFAAELFKRITLDAKISFVKMASYEGTKSSGKVKELIGWNDDVEGKDIIVVEDIVETGKTLERIKGELSLRKAASVKIATLLFKPELYEFYDGRIPIDYMGFEIDNRFVVGYGLDYNGLGRNLPGIYSLIS